MKIRKRLIYIKFIILVFRLAKSHDMFDAALTSIHLDDYFLRIILTSSNINQACYLLLDNLLWLNSVGAIEIKKRLKSMNDWSNKFWLFSTLLYLARDFHDLFGLLKIEEEDENNSKKYDPVNRYSWNEQAGSYTKTNLNNFTTRSILKRIFRKLKILILNKNYHPLLLDTIKNIFDVFLPLSNLNFVKISPGTQGLCGLISSIISLIVTWDAKYKLKP